ncbi:TIGR00341 family protein [Halonatronum saccharophilum]|uniref:TIGR00341 family protein n=1 Tax=Halonatronum saccharophilum TaxID=150060 RepID=UPI0004855215|nr:TIGR00341 family protein [Halonatronum saccharophilum]
MQVIHANFAAGEGDRAISLLMNLGFEEEDYKLIQSNTGDLLIVNLLYGNADLLIDKMKKEFDFVNNAERSLVIFTPDTVIPKDEEKAKVEDYRASRETIVTYAKDNSELSSEIIFMAIVAAIVATLGLILDNTAVIVGSMIIAPVFGPIATMAIGIVLGDLKLFAKGMVVELAIIGIGIGVGAFFGFIIPNVTINRALEVRMLPTLPDLLVALAAGGAGAYSLLTNVKSQQLVGVVIAAALIPVMATMGIGVSIGEADLVVGAALLLFGNLFSLLLAIIVVFYFKGLKPQWWYEDTAKEMIKKSLIILTISFIILSLPLSVITYREMVQGEPEDIIRDIYWEEIGDPFEGRLLSVQVEMGEVDIILYTSMDIESQYFKDFSKRVKEEIGDEYKVNLEVIPTKRIEI